MASYGLDHLHVRTTDPERTAAFYCENFGASVAARVQAGKALRVVLDFMGTKLFVEEVPAGTPAPPPAPFLGLEHIGLVVDDLDAALAELTARGVQIESGPSSPRPGVRIAFVAVPDGGRLELLERKGG